MDGHGIMSWPSGASFKGNYSNGVKSGVGEMKWPDGRSYRGEWFEGLQHGEGTETDAFGKKTNGLWYSGHFAGVAGSFYMVPGQTVSDFAPGVLPDLPPPTVHKMDACATVPDKTKSFVMNTRRGSGEHEGSTFDGHEGSDSDSSSEDDSGGETDAPIMLVSHSARAQPISCLRSF